PSFLYSDDAYDINDFDIGLLRGAFLLKVYKHIFTGPSSALKDTPGPSAGTKAPIGKKNGLTKPTPETIAYAAVQARFVLSKQAQWGTDDGDFSNIDFFNAVLALFDDEEWATDTLNYFHK
ncbi:hypothetical protein B0H21DRAFT_699730, partial [Amylocystis lapponica]